MIQRTFGPLCSSQAEIIPPAAPSAASLKKPTRWDHRRLPPAAVSLPNVDTDGVSGSLKAAASSAMCHGHWRGINKVTSGQRARRGPLAKAMSESPLPGAELPVPGRRRLVVSVNERLFATFRAFSPISFRGFSVLRSLR